MYTFGEKSQQCLDTCDERLVRVVTRALNTGLMDFGVNYGWRDKATQNALFATGKSKVVWPNSKHNHVDVLGNPSSLAVDVHPWIVAHGVGYIPWTETRYWYFLAGVIKQAGLLEGVPVRWGGDWDGDSYYGDQTFDDLGHFEISE